MPEKTKTCSTCWWWKDGFCEQQSMAHFISTDPDNTCDKWQFDTRTEHSIKKSEKSPVKKQD